MYTIHITTLYISIVQSVQEFKGRYFPPRRWMTCLTDQSLTCLLYTLVYIVLQYTLVFHFSYRQTSMATINKFDLILPEIPYNGNKVILEYIFVNNTQYQLQTKTRIVDNEPASVEGKKIYYLLLLRYTHSIKEKELKLVGSDWG